MEIRSDAIAEVRKGGRLMGKGPDLSAFPIPRKGGAKPIALDESTKTPAAEGQREGEEYTVPHVPPGPAPTPPPSRTAAKSMTTPRASRAEEPTSAPLGQIVATTVKLDENRYLRLADAGKPGPGRLKRRTIQEMVIEALDEWFERRGL
jgi:hypothetical protein